MEEGGKGFEREMRTGLWKGDWGECLIGRWGMGYGKEMGKGLWKGYWAEC